MSFDPLRGYPRLRRWSPWLVWGGVLVVVVSLAPGIGAVGIRPGAAEVRQATVTAPRTARVKRVLVRPGDRVAVDADLVDLDTSGIDFELAIARMELERTKLTAVARELDVHDADLESAARLAQEAESATVDLAALVGDQRRDSAELAQIDELIGKQDKLVEAKLASAEQRDELRLRRSSVAQRVAEYETRLTAARDHDKSARDRLDEWRRARAKTTGKAAAPIEQRTAPSRAEVAAQEERVHQLESVRALLLLKAPIAGLVQEVLVNAGDTARLDAPLVVIVDDHPKDVVAWLDQTASRRVKVGERVKMRPSDRSGPALGGVVRALAPSLSELPARFRVVPAQPEFGRAVFITIDVDEHAQPLPGQAFDVVFEGPG